MAGTINSFGAVKVRMDRRVADSTLAKIFKIVEEAQQQKAPTQRIIEKYGGPYTALIITSTILTLLVVPTFYDSIEIARDRMLAKFKARSTRGNAFVAFVLTFLEALLALTLVRAAYRLGKRGILQS